MRKTRKSWKRLIAFIMVAMMMITTVVPATAANDDEAPYTITIVPNKNTRTGDDVSSRFKAYAIFAGDITKSGGNEYDEKDGTADKSDDHQKPHTPPTANQLSNVVWGTGIKESQYGNLLNALVGDSTAFSALGVNETDLVDSSTTLSKVQALGSEYESLNASSTLGSFFTAALKTAGYEVDGSTVSVPSNNPNGLSLANSAAVIAKAISDLNDATNISETIPNNNTALAQAFAKILAAKSSGSYTYLDTATTSTWNKDLSWGTGSDKGAWEIKNLQKAGYYLIIDTLNTTNTGTTTEYDENSDYILGVFGDQTINLKSNAATVAKDIVDGNNLKKADSAGISDTVTFRLTGTLPENYDNYATFKYIFHDTLSEGFTYDANSLNVYLKNGTNIYRVTGTSVYTLNPSTSFKNGNLTITFNNLKPINNEDVELVTSIGQTTEGTEVNAPFAIGQTWEIIVQYTAKVNQSATIGAPAAVENNPPARNKNDVWLEYSNDVNDLDSTGRTTTQTVYVYTYGLDIDKINGGESDVNKNALAGAGFALTRQNNGKTEYAVFTRSENNGSYTYKLAGWIADGEWRTSTTAWLDGVTGGNSPVDGSQFTNGTTYYLAVETIDTDASGNPTLNVEGLDAGNFTLKEVVTPDGFNTMKDIVFTITAEFSTLGDDLTSLTAAETPDRDDVKFSQANLTTGIIPVELTNTSAGFLPGTGGIGTTIFYILGGLLIVGAVVYMIFSRRKNKEEQ